MQDEEHSSDDTRAVEHLTPAAQRALAEAAQRRAERDRDAEAMPREIDGRQGPEPVRYGDWEKNGIAYDF